MAVSFILCLFFYKICVYVCISFTGIDLAFIENGFIYHTKYDTADRILTDSIQRAGTFIAIHVYKFK